MTSIKQDIFNDNTLFEYYVNFSNYSVENNFIIFESKFTTFYEKPIDYVDHQILDALEQLKEEHIFILKSRLVYKRSLQNIADESNITRERVRQIEDQAIKKLLFTIDKSLIINTINSLSDNPIIFLDDLPIKNEELKILFCELLSYKKFRKAIFDRDLMCLVKDHNFTFTGLRNKIEHYIIKSGETVFSKESLINTFQSLLPKVENIKKLIPILEKNKRLKNVGKDQYFFPFLYKPKRPMVEFIFSLYPEGIELHQEVDFIYDELNKFFPGVFKEKDKKRAIVTVAGYSDLILMWDWGKYKHLKYINPIIEEYDFSSILNYIDEHLNDTQIDLQSCFEAFEKELVNIGIISKYALHTCLKLKYPNDYTYQDSPWISKAGTEKSELRETLKNLVSENRIYSLDELIDLMHTNKTRVQQLIDNSEDIIQVRPFEYMNKIFLDISNEFLEEVINYANMKVKELDFIYIDLILDKFTKELNKYSQYDLRWMLLELLKKTSKEKKFNVSNTRIVEKGYPVTRDSLNFHVLIEKLMNHNETISIDKISNYFIVRGLSKDRIMAYFLYSKIKKIVRLDQENFTSIDKIGLSEKNINDINFILEESLVDETNLEDIFNHLNLPKISIKWNRYILTDITDHEKFLFTPSRENPIYIIKRGNQ